MTLENSQAPAAPRPARRTKTSLDGGVLFIAKHRSIMRGAEHIATAVSKTMAKRIANALNLHKPNSEGV
jgi:hypothetical protein